MNKKEFIITYFYSYTQSILSLEKADEIGIWQPPEVTIEKKDIFIPKWWDSKYFPYIYQHRYQEPSEEKKQNETFDYTIRNFQNIQHFSIGNDDESEENDYNNFENQLEDIPIIIPIPVNKQMKVYSMIIYNYWSTESYQDLVQLNVFLV